MLGKTLSPNNLVFHLTPLTAVGGILVSTHIVAIVAHALDTGPRTCRVGSGFANNHKQVATPYSRSALTPKTAGAKSGFRPALTSAVSRSAEQPFNKSDKQSTFRPPTPINDILLRKLLYLYPHRSAARLLDQGFSHGFTLGFQGPRVSRDSQCLPSAAVRPEVVLDKLRK